MTRGLMPSFVTKQNHPEQPNPMKENELNELVHIVCDEIDKHLDVPVDRIDVNEHLSRLIQNLGIEVKE